MIGLRLDRYSSQAEALPVLMTIFPLALCFMVVLPEGTLLEDLPVKSMPLIGLAGFSFLASQIGADAGKRIEGSLWKKWKGPPTTRFMRHGNQEYNGIIRERIHSHLRKLGMHVPTLTEQHHDPERADQHYEACTKELLRRTRDKTKFALVHKRLIDYGFRRNLLSLKRYGLFIAVVALLFCLLYIIYWAPTTLSAWTISICLILVLWIIIWIVLSNEKWVWRSANRYAYFLLESTLDLE